MGVGKHVLFPRGFDDSPALMNVMTAAAIKAGRGLKRDYGEVENLQVSVKGPGDFVTAADRRAEKTLFEELSRARPGYGFLMEEGGGGRRLRQKPYLAHRPPRRHREFSAWNSDFRRVAGA